MKVLFKDRLYFFCVGAFQKSVKGPDFHQIEGDSFPHMEVLVQAHFQRSAYCGAQRFFVVFQVGIGVYEFYVKEVVRKKRLQLALVVGITLFKKTIRFAFVKVNLNVRCCAVVSRRPDCCLRIKYHTLLSKFNFLSFEPDVVARRDFEWRYFFCLARPMLSDVYCLCLEKSTVGYVRRIVLQH